MPRNEDSSVQMFEFTLFAAFSLLLYAAFQQRIIITAMAFVVLYICYKVIRKKTAKYLTPEGRYIIVTGCDSGIGHALARRLDEMGCHVFATCLQEHGKGAKRLKECTSTRLHVIGLDVGKDESVSKCLEYVTKHCRNEGLWALVNNAGVNFVGDVELATMKQYLHISNVNTFGMIRMTKAFLPLIRKTKGRVLNVTSVKGRLSYPGSAAYSITKYAGETFSDILRLEMRKFGVKVVIIEPGHYGGATGCLNEEGIARIENDFKQQWAEASTDVKETYGKDYLDSQLEATKANALSSAKTVTPIIKTFEEALLNENPETRYLIDGTNQLYDEFCILARLYPFLPVSLVDYILARYLAGESASAKISQK